MAPMFRLYDNDIMFLEEFLLTTCTFIGRRVVTLSSCLFRHEHELLSGRFLC